MEELNFLKGNKTDLPQQLDDNNIYIAFADDYNEIIVNNKIWVSKEYIDAKFDELKKLLIEDEEVIAEAIDKIAQVSGILNEENKIKYTSVKLQEQGNIINAIDYLATRIENLTN